MRLIDVNTLKDRASEYTLSKDEYKRFCEIVDAEPTAYDINEVILQIEAERGMAAAMSATANRSTQGALYPECVFYSKIDSSLRKIIKIVNAGKKIKIENLRACPFCGGKAYFKKVTEGTRGDIKTFSFETACAECGIVSPKIYKIEVDLDHRGGLKMVLDERDKAVKDWNGRIKETENEKK